jgi:hypothetical protein
MLSRLWYRLKRWGAQSWPSAEGVIEGTTQAFALEEHAGDCCDFWKGRKIVVHYKRNHPEKSVLWFATGGAVPEIMHANMGNY